MTIPRKRVAQACSAAAAVAVFLPWQTAAEEGANAALGSGTGEGRIVFIVCLVTIGLIQVGWRPAWIASGFVAATAGREILSLSGNSDAGPASGLWIAAAASIVAAVLLVWEMFANVAAPGDGADPDEPGGRGLSGPLGRRRQ